MNQVENVAELLRQLSNVSDWKFAVGLHIRFANPTLLYQNYPESWIELYHERGLAFVDPTVRWAVQHEGICDWDELRDDDPENVLGQAAEHGLRFGKIVSIDNTSRSCGFFTHHAAPIREADILRAQEILLKLHDETRDVEGLPPEMLAELRDRLATRP